MYSIRNQIVSSFPLCVFLLLACSSEGEDGSSDADGDGGGAASGGAASGGAATGGQLADTGGQSTSGGTTNSGGDLGSGGEMASGGVAATGGAASSGGADGTGGIDGTGGALVEEVDAVVPSAGCGMNALSAEGSWVDQPAMDIDGRQRSWAVRFPVGYDPNRAYPLTLLFHGCGSKTNNVPMENVAGSDTILVRGASVENCWNDLATGSVDNDTESYDLPFIEAMIDEMKASSCVDENHVFGVGYSSGAWLLTHVACKLPSAFRALGTVAGEDWVHVRNLDPPQCGEGNVAQMYIQDLGDPNNQWDDHKSAKDRLLAANGCSPNLAMSVEPSPCEFYQGCGDYPVQQCLSTGEGHGRRDGFAPAAFWGFFSEFLPEN